MSIWNFTQISSKFENGKKLTLEEGSTPTNQCSVLSAQCSVKREDLNRTGSYKDRGMAYKVSQLLRDGVKEVVIGSSGNAAISLVNYANLAEIKVNIVAAPHANPAKIQLIQDLIHNSDH